jgi:hypothetical protein
VSIKIVTNEQEVSVMLRNGAVLSNTESANGIEAYRRYIEGWQTNVKNSLKTPLTK